MSFNKKELSELNDAIDLAETHYENFPVASLLFPKNIRNDVALIYRFARTADDIVDEGNDPDEIKHNKLSSFMNEFEEALNGNYKNNFWKLLHNTITSKQLNPVHFLNLLTAFEQDIYKKEYETFDELLGYCKNSANPVGRIILELNDIRDENINLLSDDICTALQLTNFWQDVKIDLKKGRIYIPQEDFKKFGADKSSLFEEQINDNLRQIIEFELERTEQLFNEGSKILNYLPFRLRWQIKWTINGGTKIIEKIKKNDYDVLNFRPTLSKIDFLIALIKPAEKNVT